MEVAMDKRRGAAVSEGTRGVSGEPSGPSGALEFPSDQNLTSSKEPRETTTTRSRKLLHLKKKAGRPMFFRVHTHLYELTVL